MKLLTLCQSILFAMTMGSAAHALAECDFGFDVTTESSAFHSITIDGVQQTGAWKSIDSAPARLRDVARYVGRLQICLATPDDQPRTLHVNGQAIEIKSPFVTSCTATLLSENRLITNHHCYYGPRLVAAGFEIVEEVRVNFLYRSEDNTAAVKTYRVHTQEIAKDKGLDALLLRVRGDAVGDLGGHFPMRHKPDAAANDALFMVHHPGGKPQQYSSGGFCQVHPRQSDIDPAHSAFRHTCESTGGSSGSLILDAQSLAVVALHNAGGLSGARGSYNKGHKFAPIDAALGLGFTVHRPDPVPVAAVDPCVSAGADAFNAMLIPDLAARETRLRQLLDQYGGCTTARQQLQTALDLVAAERATPQPALQPQPAAEEQRLCTAVERDLQRAQAIGDFAQQRAALEALISEAFDKKVNDACPTQFQAVENALAEADVRAGQIALKHRQECYDLAAPPLSADLFPDLDYNGGVPFSDIKPAAIIACQTALEFLPSDHRVMALLGRALSADGQHDRAILSTRQAARAGVSLAQVNLGFSYQYGESVSLDLEEAVKWYRRAAEQKNVLGQHNLGVMYRDGEGITASAREAARWFRRAAEQGYSPSQFQLGLFYETAEGVAKSDAEALIWYRRAAEQGHDGAQYNLARFYRDGTAVTRDYAQARDLFRQAGDQGHADALISLGLMHSRGEGGPRDPEKAADLFVVALENGGTWLLDRTAWNRATAKALQRRLRDLGVYSGAIDGSIGPGSKAAMRQLLP